MLEYGCSLYVLLVQVSDVGDGSPAASTADVIKVILASLVAEKQVYLLAFQTKLRKLMPHWR